MKKTVIAALLGATLLTTGAIAAVQDNTQPQDAPKHRMMRDPLTMADANMDGVVTRDEVTASVAAHFAKLDTNKDGKITVEERKAAREAMRAQMGRGDREGKGMDKHMRGPDGERGPRGPGKRMGGPDANGDGMLSLDEQRAQALKRFDFLDRNGDGKVDQAERQLVREMMREMGPRGHRGGRGHGRHHNGGEVPPAPPAAPATGS
ncbi:MAG: ca2+ sensor protein [Pseudomonadota bacterium]